MLSLSVKAVVVVVDDDDNDEGMVSEDRRKDNNCRKYKDEQKSVRFCDDKNNVSIGIEKIYCTKSFILSSSSSLSSCLALLILVDIVVVMSNLSKLLNKLELLML